MQVSTHQDTNLKQFRIIQNGDDQISIFTFTAKHERFFAHARHMAEMSDFKRARVGCVAVIDGRVVATGFSQQRTHPMQEYYNQFRDFHGQKNISAKLHAEISMLCSVQHMDGIDWHKADVYIYRMCRSRLSGLAKPCSACEAALRSVGVHNVFFSTDKYFDLLKLG